MPRGQLVLLVCALSLLASAARAEDLPAGDHEKLPLIVLTPRGDVSKPVITRILTQSVEVLRAKTSLRPVEVSAEAVDACRGRLYCLVRASQATSSTTTRGRRAHYVAVISVLASANQADRLSAMLIDTARAWEEVEAGGTDDELEARLNERAVIVRPSSALAADDAQADAYVRRLFTQDFRGAFENAGYWEPYGSIELSFDRGDATVMIDGQVVGVARQGTTRVTELFAGDRKVRVEKPGFEPYESVVQVREGAAVPLVVELREERASPLGHWGGLAAGASMIIAGSALTIWGATGDVNVESICLVTSGATDQNKAEVCGRGPLMLRFGYRPPGESNERASYGSGPLIAPLGYSLVLAGGLTVLGALLWEEEEGFPWRSLLIGAGAGLLTYGVSELVVGSSPD
jgi:hypothetical protein